jgi:hypothetical protein
MIYGWKIISKRIEYPVFHDNQEYTLEKTFLIGHGDGKGPEIWDTNA